MFPGLQGGPLEHVIAAKAVAFAEAARPEFRDLRRPGGGQRRRPGHVAGRRGFRLVSGGTENHQVLVDLRTFDAELTGKEAQEVLDRAGITCNRNTIPDDPRSPFVTSGLRLGSAAETTAGMGPTRCATIGGPDRPDPAPPGRRARPWRRSGPRSRELCAGFPPVPRAAGPGLR